MKTFEITIKPLSGFGTPLKGDTLFGHICWQAAYNDALFGTSLNNLLADYATNPFVVISSAYPKLDDSYALKRPDMPLDELFYFSGYNTADIIRRRKELKGRRWMLVSKDKRLSDLKADGLYLNDKKLFEKMSDTKDVEAQRQIRKKAIKSIVSDYTQPHNTINRLSGTTGEGQFAPYAVDQTVFMPDLELAVFVGLREDIKIEDVETALKQIGDTGFGKDASTGLGRFSVLRYEEIDLSSLGSSRPNGCYTLAPCLPQKDKFDKTYFSPFTRFGRHGDVLAKSGKPFKNPVIMADEGAVFMPLDSSMLAKPYLGRAITGISKAQPGAVTQGYSLFIPVKVEAKNG